MYTIPTTNNFLNKDNIVPKKSKDELPSVLKDADKARSKDAHEAKQVSLKQLAVQETLVALMSKLLQNGGPHNVTQPLPEIASNPSTNRPIFWDDAFGHRTRARDILQGVA